MFKGFYSTLLKYRCYVLDKLGMNACPRISRTIHSLTATFRSFVPIRSLVVSDNREVTDVRTALYHDSRVISNENYFSD